MLLIIDNYDSFTFNLVHYFEELGANTHVVRNDALSVDQALALQPKAICLSPGPGRPEDAGICLDLIRSAPDDQPILGVCLGHQCMGEVFGGQTVPARAIIHGKASKVSHDDSGIFTGLPGSFAVARYHSLAIGSLPADAPLIVNAQTADGEIMGIRHRNRPLHGVQFHPESIASQHGHSILANFLNIAGLPVTAALDDFALT
ncbi:aminodeoxychorismate/anthranilate synthase component II [Hyphobacterium sp. HN65]|uniref:Aminodeoxychorismate/anthranilate synthase component II n=1 Tax=Hyphobacterium lacteum TaxID=3116575 RepID=A0ABU7LLV5_9PROT|nr:aminodeoxychorismate/anthranilate synthase component II [Hyphobacterium sp. HN65]MEE2524910.1 aminodeoxychorismate/anthranilate synthase component II [Hyphobacterium sp. HN65]